MLEGVLHFMPALFYVLIRGSYSKLVANQFNSAVMANLPEAVRALDDDSSDMGIPPMGTFCLPRS